MKNKGYKCSEAVKEYIKEREYYGWRPRGERAVGFGKIEKGDSVLDLCCGAGMVARVVREKVGNKGKVVGIDQSADFIKYAKDFCNSENVEFIKGDVEKLDRIVKDQKFNVILLLASWYWIKNKRRLCIQVGKHLKKDGRFVLSLLSDDLSDEKTYEFYWKYREALKNEVRRMYPKLNLSYFDNLPVIDNDYVDKTVAELASCGFYLKFSNKIQRTFSLEDKLFTYNNPARTEWVGPFSPDLRLKIIKSALKKATVGLSNSQNLKRVTYYLTFSLDKI